MFKTYITCSASDLARDIEKAYGLKEYDINIKQLFFPGCDNDSFKALCFDADMYEDYKEEMIKDGTKDSVGRFLVCKYLRERFLDSAINTILVDITW